MNEKQIKALEKVVEYLQKEIDDYVDFLVSEGEKTTKKSSHIGESVAILRSFLKFVKTKRDE